MVADGNIHYVRFTNEDFLACLHPHKIFNALIKTLIQQTQILLTLCLASGEKQDIIIFRLENLSLVSMLLRLSVD